ncbi:hypothetical protein V5799_032804 [Amblyomma americanum]|uniref:Thioredoxin-like fold domain-containing protein n=1 Tax=Amblyomma americanum TaxID=6943 RepID=A0AAQ4DQ46_AMBAM
MDPFDSFPTSLIKLRSAQEEFESQYCAAEESEQDTLITKYIAEVSNSDDPFIVTEFGTDLEWINTSRPLTSPDLRGRIVVLDFFTYCCINCQHVLPVVKRLERQFPVDSGLLVVGVHSAKFDEEKELSSVSKALQRLGIAHPVVNDAQSLLWKRLRINCWPTLVVLGPSGQALLFLVGEGAVRLLVPFCRIALGFFQPTALSHLPLTPGALPTGHLLFPAKVCATGTKLVIADTGHHRILVTNSSGRVLEAVGGYEPGYRDGPFDVVRFRDPQGILWRDAHTVLVADTGNHAIREVDIENKVVRTLAGTGKQGTDTLGGHLGPQQSLSSPWDICLVNDVLFIAMAGSHQIWAFFFQDSELFQKKTFRKGTCVCIAGSGEEGNRNNSYPLRATFAQPSGICFQPPCSLHIADSESSSIRTLSLLDGKVKNLIGGGLNPTDLFCFGDTDGVALEAKLQHPLGVAWSATKERLYVADSYNHKVREVDVEKRACTTFLGCARGENSSSCSKAAGLNEPGGLCVLDSVLYVADTNNHCIKVVDLTSGHVEALAVTVPHAIDCDELRSSKHVCHMELAPGGWLHLCLEPPDGLAAGAPNKWKVHSNPEAWRQNPLPVGTLEPGKPVTVELKLEDSYSDPRVNVHVTFDLYLCRGDVCVPRSFAFLLSVCVDRCGPAKQSFLFSKNMYV